MEVTMESLKRERTLNKRALFRDLGYGPHPGQSEIHASTASRRVVACGVRWGKSLCAAAEALAAAMAHSSSGRLDEPMVLTRRSFDNGLRPRFWLAISS